MEGLNIGYAICGSFCTISASITQMEKLVLNGANVFPIMSEHAYSFNTRFGTAEEINDRIRTICSKEIIHTITEAEPIGPKKLFDIMIISPCTGNTLAKLSNGITDTSVTMAAKAHIRNKKPLVLAVATNDALGASAKNIGILLNTRYIYFVPFSQDDYVKKPNSMIADFTKIPESIEAALNNIQLQPVITQ